jgi:hypothetical protein
MSGGFNDINDPNVNNVLSHLRINTFTYRRTDDPNELNALNGVNQRNQINQENQVSEINQRNEREPVIRYEAGPSSLS